MTLTYDFGSVAVVASVGNTTQPTKEEEKTKKPVTCLIDYVQGIITLPHSKVGETLNLFASLFREEGTLIDCIGKSFGSTKFPSGAMTLNKQRFAWTNPPEIFLCDLEKQPKTSEKETPEKETPEKETPKKDMVKLWFSIPGGALARVDDLTTLRGLASILSPYEFKISRIDLALDDYEKLLTAEYIDEMNAKNRLVGNPKVTPIGYANEPGWTRYIGSRRSAVFLRLYDKFFESLGLIDAYRLEGEFKGLVANEHYANLQAVAFNSETIAAYIVEAVTGALRIVDGSDSQKYLCGVDPVWQTFLNHCQSKGGFRVPQPRRESSLSKTMQWLERSVKSSLATVKQALGSERFKSYFDKLMQEGKASMSTKHLHILNLLNRGDDTLPVEKPKLKHSKGFTASVNATRNDAMNATRNDAMNATRNTTVNTATNVMMNRIMNATRNDIAMQQ